MLFSLQADIHLRIDYECNSKLLFISFRISFIWILWDIDVQCAQCTVHQQVSLFSSLQWNAKINIYVVLFIESKSLMSWIKANIKRSSELSLHQIIHRFWMNWALFKLNWLQISNSIELLRNWAILLIVNTTAFFMRIMIIISKMTKIPRKYSSDIRVTYLAIKV